jgi:hypothetical protein
MKDHNGNELVVGDWVRVRNDTKHRHVQIIEMPYGQVITRDVSTSNTYWEHALPPRGPRAFIKIEPEELI